MRTSLPLALLALVFAASGCDSDALADRTYAEAEDFPMIALGSIPEAIPGSYNVTAYVLSVDECAPEEDCVAEGSLDLVRSITDFSPQLGVTLFVDAPGQFKAGAQYTFSVRVDAESSTPASPRLLGYTRL